MVSKPTTGYRIQSGLSDAFGFDHHLCGISKSRNALSPNSGLPLLCLASLDTKDRRLELESFKEERLDLLYSWTCAIPEGEFVYRISQGAVKIISFSSGSGYPDFPFENYPESFPEVPVSLIAVPDSEAATARMLNANRNFADWSKHRELTKPYHQIGGEPVFVQKYSQMACPACKKDMAFMAVIGNNNGQPRGFCDNDYVQVIYNVCDICFAIGVYNICD